MYNPIGSMVVPSMLVVLVALAIMVGLIYLMRYIVAQINRGKNGTGQSAPAKSQATAPATAIPVQAQPAPVAASASLAGETVAAICAAVSCVIDAPHTVTSIAPVAQTASAVAAPAQPVRQRPVWGFAGMQQNTRPF